MKIFEITVFGVTIAPSYYGLMYAISFILGYLILKKRKVFKENELDSILLHIFVGIILGGRLGYVLFYDLSYYMDNPSQILATWKGGMSFHGGVIGVIVAMMIFAYNKNKNDFKNEFLKTADQIVTVLPIGLGLGRIGNYLNKELLGKEYSGFLSVEKNGKYYFPSPLLEAFFEGFVLYVILYHIFKNSKNNGKTAGAFLLFYAIFRFSIEFFRMPDVQIGYILGQFTMGQILSIPMFLFGIYFFTRKEKPNKVLPKIKNNVK